MITIKNPNFKDANAARLTKYKAEIESYIASLPADSREFLTLDEIRADVLAMGLPGVTAADVTDAKLIQIAQAYGLDIVSE